MSVMSFAVLFVIAVAGASAQTLPTNQIVPDTLQVAMNDLFSHSYEVSNALRSQKNDVDTLVNTKTASFNSWGEPTAYLFRVTFESFATEAANLAAYMTFGPVRTKSYKTTLKYQPYIDHAKIQIDLTRDAIELMTPGTCVDTQLTAIQDLENEFGVAVWTHGANARDEINSIVDKFYDFFSPIISEIGQDVNSVVTPEDLHEITLRIDGYQFGFPEMSKQSSEDGIGILTALEQSIKIDSRKIKQRALDILAVAQSC